MAPVAEIRSIDRGIWVLATARMVSTAGFSMVLPFLAIHLTTERGAAAITVGLIWTVAGACGAAMQWVAGAASDRIGRKRLMLLSMVLRAINLAAMGFATAAHASFWVIGALCVLNNVLRAFFDPVANALVADLAPAERRVTAFSIQRVGTNVGWATGPAVAAIASDLPYSELFYWGVPVTLLAMLAVSAIREPARAARPTGRALQLSDLLAFRDDKVFVRFLLASVAFFILQVQLYQTLSIYAARVLHLDRAQVGTLYTLNGILVVLLQLPAIAYIRRMGTRGALVLGCVGYAASYAAAGLALGYGTLLLCVVGITLSEIITAPAQQATVATMAPPDRLGAYSGMFGLCQIVGQSAGPLVGTVILDATPARAAWFLIALFGVAAALAYRPRPAPVAR